MLITYKNKNDKDDAWKRAKLRISQISVELYFSAERISVAPERRGIMEFREVDGRLRF